MLAVIAGVLLKQRIQKFYSDYHNWNNNAFISGVPMKYILGIGLGVMIF